MFNLRTDICALRIIQKGKRNENQKRKQSLPVDQCTEAAFLLFKILPEKAGIPKTAHQAYIGHCLPVIQILLIVSVPSEYLLTVFKSSPVG